MKRIVKILYVQLVCMNALLNAKPFILPGPGDEPIWFSPEIHIDEIKKHLDETKGADIDKRNSWGQTGLMFAINYGFFGDFGRAVSGTETKPNLVETLISYGADVNAKSEQSAREEDHSFANTPLHYVAIIVNPRDSVPLIDYLIRKGADINAQNNLLETPLMWSLQVSLAQNRRDVFHEMITNLADVNMQNNIGNTFLHLTIINKDIDWIQYLMKNFGSMFDLNLKSREGWSGDSLSKREGWTPLELAIKTMQPESEAAIKAFKPLGLEGDRTDVRDMLGRTPLMLAVIRNDMPFVKRQLETLHADINAVDTTKYQNGAIHFAVIRRYKAIPFVSFLLDHKADPNFKNAFGDTPLHYLIKYNLKSPERNAIAKLLIEKGAKPDLPNKKGETPIDNAEKVDLAFAKQLKRWYAQKK